MLKTLSTGVILFFALLGLIEINTLSKGHSIAALDEASTWTKVWTTAENHFWDFRSKHLQRSGVSSSIILLEIDDASISSIGRFPWPRSTWAKIVDKLAAAHAKVLAFDVYFSEPENSCIKNSDSQLAKSFLNFNSAGGQIVLPYSTSAKPLYSGPEDDILKEIPAQIYEQILPGSLNDSTRLVESVIEKKVFPHTDFLESKVSLGHVQALTDLDGVFRHYPVIAKVDGLALPSLALAAAVAYRSPEYKIVDVERDGVLLWNANSIYLNTLGETPLSWKFQKDYFPKIGVKDLMGSSLEDLTKLKDKIIFIGSTAYGAYDLRNTPYDPIMPGVYFHMNQVEDLLQNQVVLPASKNLFMSTLLFVTLMTAILILNFRVQSNKTQHVFVTVVICSLYIFDHYWLIPNGYRIYILPLFVKLIFTYITLQALRFYFLNQEKKKIQSTFSRYLSPGIIDDVLQNPAKLKLGGEKKNITVFFSDIRNFTSHAEKMTPEQLSSSLNIYMTAMTDILFAQKGTLDKYIGDAIVAYWGAPIAFKEHAYYALKAALKMTERLPEINTVLSQQGVAAFQHGIGINTGECVVGNMGSNQIFSYTALGDSMNLGARIESLCKFYGAEILFSGHTLKELEPSQKSELLFRQVDRIRVKGKNETLDLFELLPKHHKLINQPNLLEQFQNALNLYLKRKFELAFDEFTTYLEEFSEDKAAKHLCELCENYKKNPPPENWDGSYVHLDK